MPLTPMDCWRLGWRLWLGGLEAQAALIARAWGAVLPGAEDGGQRPHAPLLPGCAATGAARRSAGPRPRRARPGTDRRLP